MDSNKRGADGRIDIENDEHQQDHIAELRQRLEQRTKEHAQFRDDRNHTQYAKNPHQPCYQRHVAVVDRDKADQHHQGVEQVPWVAEKGPLVWLGDKPDADLDEKDECDQNIQPAQNAHAGCGYLVGLRADEQGRRDDH